MADEVLLFLSYKPNDPALAELRRQFEPLTKPLDLESLAGMLRRHLGLTFTPKLRAAPSRDFVLALEGVDEPPPPINADYTVVFALQPLGPEHAKELFEVAEKPRTDLVRELRVAVDLPTGLSGAWCPGDASFPLFGDIDLALTQLRASAAAAKGARGQNVNVVIIDQGINSAVLARRFPGASFVGGWATPEFGKGGPQGPFRLIAPGAWRDDGLGPTVTHGTKMASLVLSVAREARILDLAMLPSHILNLRTVGTAIGFLSWAVAAYWTLVGQIPWIRQFPGFRGPWVLNNSWGVFDLSTDLPPGSPQNYGSNPNHPLNVAVAELPRLGIADVVFAAGNCGQCCPDPRCGAGQIGPARSIHGVAAIKDALTVAAVRGDEIWLGYSSQGPAAAAFGSTKPDLCAPSQFAAGDDWNRSFTGTSSACALATGVIAAKRSLVPPGALSPPALRALAVARARRVVHHPVPDERHGAGMIDADRLTDA